MNKRGLPDWLTLITALPVFLWGLLMLLSRWFPSAAAEFIRAASPWVLMGIGIAVYFVTQEKK